jgi:hypothetical protein
LLLIKVVKGRITADKPMDRKILVISDCLTIQLEIILNTMRLAQRTEARVVVLALLTLEDAEGPSPGFGLRIREGRDEYTWKETVARYGWEAAVEVRIGDPASEFMKFLAESGRFEALVWAGSEAMMGSRRDRNHWINKVAGLAPGPWVAPASSSGRRSKR